MTRPRCLWHILTCLVLLAPGSVRAEVHHDPAWHYTVELPADWGLAPQAAITQLNSLAKKGMATANSCDKAFQARGAAPLSYPHVLVQARKFKPGGMSYEDIEEECAKLGKGDVKKIEGGFSQVLRNVRPGTVVVDRASHRIITRSEAGQLEVLSVGMIGAEGIVFLHCCAPKNSFDGAMPIFDKILESFSFEPGHTYEPKQAALGVAGNAALEGALVGVVAGAFVGMFLALRRQRRRSQELLSELPEESPEIERREP
jgi:hypothetical protein